MSKVSFHFFSDAEIPDDMAVQYTDIFISNWITVSVLSELDKQSLHEMGITVLSDKLAIIKHAHTITSVPDTKHTSPSSPSLTRDTTAKAKLPTVSSEMTKPQFRKFRIDWDICRNITNIPQSNIISHLYNASIVNTTPDFLCMTESEFLDMVENLVTKTALTMLFIA